MTDFSTITLGKGWPSTGHACEIPSLCKENSIFRSYACYFHTFFFPSLLTPGFLVLPWIFYPNIFFFLFYCTKKTVLVLFSVSLNSTSSICVLCCKHCLFRHYLSKNAIVFTTIIFPVLKKSPFSYTTASLPSLPSLRMLFTIFSKNFKALQLVSKMVLRCIRWFSTFYIS